MNLIKKFGVVAMSAMMLVSFAACSDDKDTLPADDVVGLYVGTTVLDMTGADAPDAPTPAKIRLDKSGENVKMTLVESAFDAMLGGAVISIDGVTVKKDTKGYVLSGAGEVDFGGNKVPVKVKGEGSSKAMKLLIEVPVVPSILEVSVTFEGARK